MNARAFEVYRIGEAGPAPCEKNSRWRKFAFTKYDVQNARYLRWGEEGVTTQSQQVRYLCVVLLYRLVVCLLYRLLYSSVCCCIGLYIQHLQFLTNNTIIIIHTRSLTR